MALAGPWVRSAVLSQVSNCFPSSLAVKKDKLISYMAIVEISIESGSFQIMYLCT
jgi:hypothetical protein